MCIGSNRLRSIRIIRLMREILQILTRDGQKIESIKRNVFFFFFLRYEFDLTVFLDCDLLMSDWNM